MAGWFPFAETAQLRVRGPADPEHHRAAACGEIVGVSADHQLLQKTLGEDTDRLTTREAAWQGDPSIAESHVLRFPVEVHKTTDRHSVQAREGSLSRTEPLDVSFPEDIRDRGGGF